MPLPKHSPFSPIRRPEALVPTSSKGPAAAKTKQPRAKGRRKVSSSSGSSRSSAPGSLTSESQTKSCSPTSPAYMSLCRCHVPAWRRQACAEHSLMHVLCLRPVLGVRTSPLPSMHVALLRGVQTCLLMSAGWGARSHAFPLVAAATTLAQESSVRHLDGACCKPPLEPTALSWGPLASALPVPYEPGDRQRIPRIPGAAVPTASGSLRRTSLQSESRQVFLRNGRLQRVWEAALLPATCSPRMPQCCPLNPPGYHPTKSLPPLGGTVTVTLQDVWPDIIIPTRTRLMRLRRRARGSETIQNHWRSPDFLEAHRCRDQSTCPARTTTIRGLLRFVSHLRRALSHGSRNASWPRLLWRRLCGTQPRICFRRISDSFKCAASATLLRAVPPCSSSPQHVDTVYIPAGNASAAFCALLSHTLSFRRALQDFPATVDSPGDEGS